MSAQQKYLYQYAYLDGSSFNAIENNNIYNDERGNAEIMQNYNHNSLNLNFKAGEHTAKALSVLLANNEVGLILRAIAHNEITGEEFDVYDLVKIGNIGLTPNVHFYEVGGEFLSNQINNIDFLTQNVVVNVNTGEEEYSDAGRTVITIEDEDENTYNIFADILTNETSSFYYPTGDDEAPVALIDLRDLTAFSITFQGDTIPANFLSGFVNESCEMTITNAGSIMKIGDNAFAGSVFSNIVANFSGIRELGRGVQLAATGGTVTTANPLGLVAYDDLTLQLTNDVKEIDGLIIASDFFASGSKILLNDTCNALSHYKGILTEIKNCTIVEDFADLTNLSKSGVTFDNCTFEVNQDFSANPATQTLTIKNCNQERTGEQTFTFTGFSGEIIIENSFKSAEATYVVDDTAAYALEIDNDSFINAGTDSGSLNKVLTNENRDLPTLVGAGAFLQINGYNISSFSGNSFLTVDGTILTISEVTSIVFGAYKQWDLRRGDFSYLEFDIASAVYLYVSSSKVSNILSFTDNSFEKIVHNTSFELHILASQLLEILAATNCFTTNVDVMTVLVLVIYNDLPDTFNYLSIARNDTSFQLTGIVNITINNDSDDLLKNVLEVQYPEYVYA